MGKYAKKTANRKLKKAEKSKVKLKVSYKTELPKGQNVTNTNFKVKKIVLKDQLKHKKESEIVSKSYLNIKELLSRINHNNVPFRCGALTGLIELISTHGITSFLTHLSPLLDAGSQLILDRESDIRSTSMKLLSLILSQVSENQLTPHFGNIVKYLACAMSHIDVNIRESSLEMLDILISKNIRLTALHCQRVILPAFLDFISNQCNPSERRLTIQYNNIMTSNIWRIKVLMRLYSLLQAIVHNHMTRNSGDGKPDTRKIQYNDAESVYVSLYPNSVVRTKSLDIGSLSKLNNSIDNKSTEIQAYTEMLVPLLLDIFTEAAPNSQKIEREFSLSTEAAILLKYISDIILLLWKIFSISDSPAFMKCWFSEKFGSMIMDRLITNKFPFVLREDRISKSFNNKKKQKSFATAMSLSKDFSELINDNSCMEINLILCNVYVLLISYVQKPKHSKKISNYISDTIKICGTLPRPLVERLLSCVDDLFSADVKLHSKDFNLPLFISIIKEVYDNAVAKNDTILVEHMFSYLTKIVLNRNLESFRKVQDLQCWIYTLPKMLTNKKISFSKVKCIADIARCNIPSFINSLDGYIESILDNLSTIQIIGANSSDKIEAKTMIANMLYFVQSWDDEFVKNLNTAIENQYFGNLCHHIKCVVNYKLSETLV